MNKKIIVLLIIALLVLLSGCDASPESEFIGCVIRNTGDGWYAINDQYHEPIGITSVETTSKCIRVNYPEKTQVVTFSSTVDETMASQGYTVGASVGESYASICIYDQNLNLVNPNDYIDSLGNIWVSGYFLN